MSISIDTHLFHPNVFVYDKGMSNAWNKSHEATWQLWFVGNEGEVVSCTHHVAKPTKRTVRKLRREFRNGTLT